MNKIIKYIPVFLCIAALCSCNETKIPDFEAQPGLYFYRGTYTSATEFQRDSITLTFYPKGVGQGEELEQALDVRTLGPLSQQARPFSIRQINEGEPDAAIAGKHYVAFDDPRMVELLKIPADSVSYKFPVICINDPELADKTVRLEIGIVPNEYFNVGIIDRGAFLIKISDMATRPAKWPDQEVMSWQAYFGKWSAVKMKFVSQICGFTDFDAEYANPKYPFEFYGRKMYRALDAYNNEHPGDPMKDENDNLVEFPIKYAN